jgi:hypothetical protein
MPAIYRDNDSADTPATQLTLAPYCYYYILRQTDSAAMPAITILIAPIRLRSIYADRTYTPTINRPSDRRALCLTTITTAAGTVLLPESTLAALPAANQYLATLL